MPNDLPSTLQPLIGVLGSLALVGTILAIVMFVTLRKTRLALAIERQRAAELKAQRLTPNDPAGAPMVRLPMPAISDRDTKPDDDWVTKLQQLEENLAEACRARDTSEQALRQSKLQVQRRRLEAAKLASRVDDLALNLEETRILVAEKDRQIVEIARHGERAEAEASELRETAVQIHQELEQARQELSQLDALRGQLQDKQRAYATLERMLQDSTASELQLRLEREEMSYDRDQIETQNIELKYILDKLGGGLAVRRSSHEFDEAAPERGTRPAVMESDIREAVIGLEAKPSIRPTLSLPAASQEPGNGAVPDPERELRDARLRLQVLESGMGDLEYLREQNAKLRDELLQDKGAARELTALSLEHKRLKVDLQLAEQRVAAQNETIERLSHVASELQDHKEELELLRTLRVQVRDLHAENFALRNAPSGTFRARDALEHPQSDARELAATPLDTAVLSDHLGLPVAVTGSLPAESLAAVSGIAAQIAVHVRELLPIGPISTVQWVDQYGMTVTCKLFKLAGDDMAMTALASGNPSEQTLRETLKQVLGSIGWTENGPQTDLSDSAVG